jgi:hypothetical protein
MKDTFLGVGDGTNPAREGVSPMKKVLGVVVLAVAMLMPAPGLVAGEKEIKKTEETQQKPENAMKTREQKERMTLEQGKQVNQAFEEFNKYLNALLQRAG